MLAFHVIPPLPEPIRELLGRAQPQHGSTAQPYVTCAVITKLQVYRRRLGQHAKMPPRIHSHLPLRTPSHPSIAASQRTVQIIPPYLSSKSRSRSASILSSLSDNPSAYHKRIRRGRGPSSGKGKTSGRGHKGQRQHGKVPRDFEGGQTPIEIVHGKRGFKNVYET